MAHRSRPVRRGGRRRLWLPAATAALAVAIASSCSDPSPSGGRDDRAAGARPTSSAPDPSAPPAADPAGTAPPPPAPGPTEPPPASAPGVDAEAAEPVRVDIARIGVSATVIPLGLDAAGALEVPTDFAQAGWWTGGPEPGERGPAVVVGHVDSRRGPAVFYRLRELQPGDVVVVHRADGSSVEFVVDRLEQHPKAAFPTDAVYGPGETSELRLITCGGPFDSSTGHYLDNHVAFAHRR